MNSVFTEDKIKLYSLIPEIIMFVREHGDGIFNNYTDEMLADCLAGHIKFGTLICLFDDKGLMLVERWNPIDQEIFYSVDTVIRPDCRSVRTLKKLMELGVNQCPNKNLKYVLYRKGQRMELGYRVHDIRKFLGRNYKLEVDKI